MAEQFANQAMGSARVGVCAALAGAALALTPASARAQAAPPPGGEAPAARTPEVTPAAPSPAPPAGAGDGALVAGQTSAPPPPATPPLPAVAPVIPDQEFNAAIPSLDVPADPALDQPLEPLDAFERRIAAQQAAAATAPRPAPPPAAGAADQAVGGAPVDDAELNKPLAPLGEFQVEPVTLAHAEERDDAAQVRYTVKVNGLAAADKQTDDNLAGQFEHLSALRAGRGEAANLAMVAARLAADSALLQRILTSEGWYEASVRTRVDQGEAADKTSQLVAVLDVAPGKRYVLARIVVDATPTVPPGLIADNIALKPGEPIVAARVQGAEAQVSVALPQNGYPFFKLGQRDVLLDQQTGEGVYTLPIDPGPRARFGDIATRGKLAFDADHVEVLARFRRGELYDSRKVDDLRQALVATGLFSTVSVEPQQTQLDAGADAGGAAKFATIMVDQTAGPPRTLAATAGYGSGEGIKITASWQHRNLFPPEGALIVGGTLGSKEQGAGVIFRRSNDGQRDRTFEAGIEGLHTSYDAYSAYTGRLHARMSRDSTPLWQKRWTWAAGAQLLGTAETVYDFATASRVRRTYYIAGLQGQVGFDTSDNLLNPTRGFRLGAQVEPQGSVRGGFTPYARVQLDGSAYQPFGSSFVLAGRLRYGTILGAALNDIAPSQRFYAGGGGSVRGYAYQRLGQLDPNGDPIGGRSVAEGSVEGRYRFGNYGVVAFFDAGQSFTTTTPNFHDVRYGVGVGGRFYTNFGPFRIDVATPIKPRKGDSRFNLYVSIGQAF